MRRMWSSRPRPARRILVVGIGAVVAGAVFLTHDSDPEHAGHARIARTPEAVRAAVGRS